MALQPTATHPQKGLTSGKKTHTNEYLNALQIIEMVINDTAHFSATSVIAEYLKTFSDGLYHENWNTTKAYSLRALKKTPCFSISNGHYINPTIGLMWELFHSIERITRNTGKLAPNARLDYAMLLEFKELLDNQMIDLLNKIPKEACWKAYSQYGAVSHDARCKQLASNYTDLIAILQKHDVKQVNQFTVGNVVKKLRGQLQQTTAA